MFDVYVPVKMAKGPGNSRNSTKTPGSSQGLEEGGYWGIGGGRGNQMLPYMLLGTLLKIIRTFKTMCTS